MIDHDSDFYEDDEPIEDIGAAWERGEKGLTGPPYKIRNCTFSPHNTSSGISLQGASGNFRIRDCQFIPVDST